MVLHQSLCRSAWWLTESCGWVGAWPVLQCQFGHDWRQSTPVYRVLREPVNPAHGGTWPDAAEGVVQVHLRASGMQVSLVVSMSPVPRLVLGRQGGPVSESLSFPGFWCIF